MSHRERSRKKGGGMASEREREYGARQKGRDRQSGKGAMHYLRPSPMSLFEALCVPLNINQINI